MEYLKKYFFYFHFTSNIFNRTKTPTLKKPNLNLLVKYLKVPTLLILLVV